MTKAERKKLARRIAQDIMTPRGTNAPCEQLILSRRHTENCGWALGPLADRIEELLAEPTQEPSDDDR